MSQSYPIKINFDIYEPVIQKYKAIKSLLLNEGSAQPLELSWSSIMDIIGYLQSLSRVPNKLDLTGLPEEEQLQILAMLSISQEDPDVIHSHIDITDRSIVMLTHSTVSTREVRTKWAHWNPEDQERAMICEDE